MHGFSDDRSKSIGGDDRLELLHRAYAGALLQGDDHAAHETISDAIAASYDEAAISDHIVAPALRLVGDLWARGDVGIADEHLATEISLRVLTLQHEAFRVARRRSSRRILLAAVEGEQHVMGLRMAASLLLHAGFDIRLLGADLPLHALSAAVDRHEPAVVGLTGTLPRSAGRLGAAIELVQASGPRPGIIIGGRAVDGRFETIPGVAVCRYLGDVVGQVEGLAQRPSDN